MTPVVLTGAPFERGRGHGAALGNQIRAHLGAWLASLAEAGVGEPSAYVADMLAATDFRSAIAQHTPDLWDEVLGIAAGAEVPTDLLFGLQLLDEEWAYRLRAGRDGKLEKCSSLAIAPASGPTWIGQNMDLGGYTEGYSAILSFGRTPAQPDALVFTVAGMIGLMGVNAAGVGVCVNSLPQLPSASEGLPVAFVLRRLLQAPTFTEACDLVLNLPHATNQHYLIAGPGAVRSFEASCKGVTEYLPSQPSRVFHTNHPLAAPCQPEPEGAGVNSAARLHALQARLGVGEVNLDEIQAALGSRDDPANPVCRVRGEPGGVVAFTTGSMISRLTASSVESWVSPGPPSRTGYSRLALAPA